MKKIWTLLLLLGLFLSTAPTGLALSNSADGSVNMMFAQLQMELAESAKNSALTQMDTIRKIQEEQKQVSSYLNQARALQAQAKSIGLSACTQMPGDMKRYMDENRLSYDKTGGDDLHDYQQWDVAIRSLESRQERLAADTQTQMVSIQDFMGQYNSYIQGASSAQSQGSGTLTSLARGQSLFSTDGSAGLAPVTTSLVAGVLLGMLIMWGVQRRRNRRQSQ